MIDIELPDVAALVITGLVIVGGLTYNIILVSTYKTEAVTRKFIHDATAAETSWTAL